MSTIAIIPAKALSTRIPNKNIVDLNGKPLILHTVEKAIKVFDSVIIATDSNPIIGLVKKYGLTIVPHPKGDIGATNVCIETLEKHITYGNGDSVFMLQPTSPFRSIGTLRRALYDYNLVNKEDTPITIIGVEEVNKKITYMDIGTTIEKRNFLIPFFVNSTINYQNGYRVNGALFGTTVKNLLRKRAFVKDHFSMPFLMSKIESIEIDTPDDLLIARAVAKDLNL